MNFKANDHVATGSVTVEVGDDRRHHMSPVSVDFYRTDEEGNLISFGFNMSASEAKRMALYILEQL